MQNSEVTLEEVLRISDLYAMDILDTLAEKDYDDFVELAFNGC